MNDAGAVVISPWESCFYQTGVNIRKRISRSWPCKRPRKKKHLFAFRIFTSSFHRIQHSLREHSFFPFQLLDWIGFRGQSKLNDMSLVTSCQRDVHASHCTCTCREVALCLGLLTKSYFLHLLLGYPGRLCDLLQWVRILGEKKTLKTLALPEDRCWLWVRRTKALILPIATSVPLYNKYFRSLKIWLKPANLKHFVIVAL